MSKKTDTVSASLLTFNPKGTHVDAEKVLDAIAAKSSREFGKDANTSQINSILQKACNSPPAHHVVPTPVYNAPRPGVNDPVLLADLQKNSNKKVDEKYQNDLHSFPANKTTAYHFIFDDFVVEGSKMHMALKGHTPFKEMIRTDSRCPVKLARMLRFILIEQPNGEKATEFNLNIRKAAADVALKQLKFTDSSNLDDFIVNFREKSETLDKQSDNRHQLTEQDLIASLMIKMVSDSRYRTVYHEIMDDKIPNPETSEQLFTLLRKYSKRLQEGSGSHSADGNFVLAATEQSSTSERPKKSAPKKPGVQKNNTIWVDPEVWAKMSADARKQHGAKNAILRAANKSDQKKKAALLAAKKTKFDGEHSSGDDSDSPYARALVVTSKKKAKQERKEQKNLAKFDRHMNGLPPSLTTESTSDDDDSSDIPTTSTSEEDSSIDGSSSSGSASEQKEFAQRRAESARNEQFARFREAVANKPGPKLFQQGDAPATAPQRMPEVPDGRGKLFTVAETENMVQKAANDAVQIYIDRLEQQRDSGSGVVVTYSSVTTASAYGAQKLQKANFSATGQGGSDKNVIGKDAGASGVTSPQSPDLSGELGQIVEFDNLVDPVKTREVFLDGRGGFFHSSDSKGTSSEPEGMIYYHQNAQQARGTGILSRLSWLFMIIVVVVSYALGAMRNGGATAIPSALTPAAVVRNHGGSGADAGASRQQQQPLKQKQIEYVLMAKSGQRSRFDQFDKNHLTFDPGAMLSVFKNRDFLFDIIDCEPGSLGGINDNSSSLDYDQCGTITGTSISNVVLCKGAIANILCPQTSIEQGYQQEYVAYGDYYTLSHSDGGLLMFGRVPLRNGSKTTLYLMDLRTLRPPVDSSLSLYKTVAVTQTVTHKKAKYTKREVINADKARRYLDVIGNPPLRASIDQLRATRNAPVSEADIKRCYDIYGPSVASLKGNSTKKTAPAARNDTELPDEVPTDVYMEVDIMWVKGMPFLLGVAVPLDYAMCVHLPKGRGAAYLEKGIKAMTAKLKSRNFNCRSIRADNEGGIAKQSTTEEIQRLGIELPLTGAGQHCPHVERRIRWVKEKYRRIEHGLAFAMNKVLVSWAVLGSTRQTNMQRTASSTSILSPREKFMGRPFDFKLDGRVAFGSYIQLTVRDTDNTSSARTEGCIALFSRDNLTGSIYAFHIATQAIVVRDHFSELPMPDALISYMDKIAAEDGLSRGSEPFAVSEYGAPDDEEYPDDAATNKPTAFKPYNESSAGVQPDVTIEQPPREPEGFVVTNSSVGGEVPEVPNSRGAATGVTVEDVDEEADAEYNPTKPPVVPPKAQAQASGAQLFRGRGAAMTNSEDAPISARTRQGLVGSTALLVGTDFNDPVFESKFKAQLYHTRDWHDRDFAFVISWNHAIKTYGEPARNSIEKELQQFIDKGVWHPVSFEGMSKEQRKAIIRAKMFVTEKFFPNGGFDKIKSRLVARGDMQDRSLYGDDDTSAPTAELSSVFSVAAIAACESRYVATCDIGGAFLNADMFKGSGRTVIVKLDPHITKMLTKLKPDYEAFVGDDGYLFVELDKAMYGCIESAKLWYEHLRGVLVSDMGFTQNMCDQCTFNKTDISGVQVTVILHVDDMKITCANKMTLDAILLSLCQRFKETKCHYGPCVPFLGMDFDYKVPGEVRITMLGMEADILSTSGVTGVAKTPATEALFEVDTDKQPVEDQDQDWFRSNVAKLLYLGKRARPEILTATTFLATRAAKADSDDMGKLRRVIRYLRGSAGRGIRLCPGALGVSVRAYVDAAYGVHMDGKSHTGVSIVIGEAGPIFVRSTKQPIVAKSSTEAELIATSDSANQIFHMRNFFIEQGYGDKPATIFQDNMSCMALLAKGKSTSMRTRHIQIRYFWVKERVDNGEAVIMHMRSESMGPANALTKPLVGSQFVEERRQLTNWD